VFRLCFRPLDYQEQPSVIAETTAKLYIQFLVKRRAVKLYSSFVLIEEVNANKDDEKAKSILGFIKDNSTGYVAKDKVDILKATVDDIMTTGVKEKDATHVACAILAKCNYFVTTDKRLLKYKSDKIRMINPIEFGRIWEEESNV
jgi:predicted nucleic acid-binding protein